MQFQKLPRAQRCSYFKVIRGQENYSISSRKKCLKNGRISLTTICRLSKMHFLSEKVRKSSATFQSISTPRTDWILTEFWLNFDCVWATFWLYLGYILAAFSLHFGFILTAFWINFDWILTDIWLNFYHFWVNFICICMHFGCISTAFRLNFGWYEKLCSKYVTKKRNTT